MLVTPLSDTLYSKTTFQVILKEVVKHPFAIAVFEDKIYWSDFNTHSIDSCEKFTGKNHHTLIKESKDFIYGMSIYHSALHKRIENPCASAFCSDICLLNEVSYSCACSEGRLLQSDQHTCQGKLQCLKQLLYHRNLRLTISCGKEANARAGSWQRPIKHRAQNAW